MDRFSQVDWQRRRRSRAAPKSDVEQQRQDWEVVISPNQQTRPAARPLTRFGRVKAGLTALLLASSLVAFMIAAMVLGSILAVILVVLVGVAITIGLFRSAMYTVRRPRPFGPAGKPRGHTTHGHSLDASTNSRGKTRSPA